MSSTHLPFLFSFSSFRFCFLFFYLLATKWKHTKEKHRLLMGLTQTERVLEVLTITFPHTKVCPALVVAGPPGAASGQTALRP